MPKPSITKRTTKGAALTYSELDTNFQNLADATLTLTAGSGGTAVTADLNGNITLVAGTGVTLTGNNTAKTVTINASAGSNSFGSIEITGNALGSPVVADSANDTLSLNAGTGIYLTTNPTNDIITIESTVTGLTNPLTSDLTLGNYKILDTNGEATIQSTQGLMVKSNAYANAELTITPGDISNATSRISTKEGVLVINTKLSGSVAAYINLDPNGDININATGGNQIAIGTSANGVSISCGSASTDKVLIDSPLQLNGITNTERDALSAVNGMLIYNTTTGTFQGYQGGSWQNLI